MSYFARSLSGLIILFCLFGSITPFFLPFGEAEGGAIYIRGDGTVDPPTASITQIKNDTYVLTSDINESIVIERENALLDGSNHLVRGDGASGLLVSGRSNITIMNIRITGFFVGIKLENSSDSTLSSSTVTGNGFSCLLLENSTLISILDSTFVGSQNGVRLQGSGGNVISNNLITGNANCSIYLSSSTNNTISRNTMNNNAKGLLASYSSNNTISDNTFARNTESGIVLDHSYASDIYGNTARDNGEFGIYLVSSGKSSLSRNTMSGNKYNFGVEGTSMLDMDNDVESFSNIADGKPIYYLKNEAGIDLDEQTQASTIYIVNSTYVSVRNLNLTKNLCGISISYSNYLVIENVSTSQNYYGIRLKNCFIPYLANPIFGIFRSKQTSNVHGIYLENCHNYSIAENKVVENNLDGISLYSSLDNVITDNEASLNRNGIALYDSDHNQIVAYELTSLTSENANCGIYLQNSSHNYVWSNNITKNTLFGIQLKQSSENEVIDNSVTDNGEGICLRISCNNNTVSQNHVAGNMGELKISIADPGPQGQGIYAGFASHSTISDNVVENNSLGIYVFASEGSVISNNTMEDNVYGFGVFGAEKHFQMTVENNIVNKKPIIFKKNLCNDVLNSSTDAAAIYLVDCFNVTIRGFTSLTNNYFGLCLVNTHNSTIDKCTLANDYFSGCLLLNCTNILGTDSTFSNVQWGVYFNNCANTTFFRNNFFKSTVTPWFVNLSDVLFDSDSQGNCWGDAYNGTDVDGNGIGDTPFIIKDGSQDGFTLKDNYPLMKPWVPIWVFEITLGARTYEVSVFTNSTIVGHGFNQTEKKIWLDVLGPDGTKGFCNVTIPREPLDAESNEWRIIIGNQTVSPSVAANTTYTSIFFAYDHSMHTVTIEGTRTLLSEIPFWLQGWFWLLIAFIPSSTVCSYIVFHWRKSREIHELLHKNARKLVREQISRGEFEDWLRKLKSQVPDSERSLIDDILPNIIVYEKAIYLSIQIRGKERSLLERAKASLWRAKNIPREN